MGEDIPDEVLASGAGYITANEGEYQKSTDMYADATWALASLSDPQALIWWSRIDPEKLSRHGYIAYISAAQKLGTYTLDLERGLIKILDTDLKTSGYWNR
jgi:hypothetical protein